MHDAFLYFAQVKVLILHQHFKIPTIGGAIRSYYLARALVERGVGVVVITGHNEKYYRSENIDGIQVHYLPVPYDNRFGFYRRIFSFDAKPESTAMIATLSGAGHTTRRTSCP